MSQLILRPTFAKDLDGLRTSSRKHYQRASELLLELQRGRKPTAPTRTESRIPHCIKYELPDGYRLVLQRAEGNAALIALAVGKHDRVESFLDGHKGYIFDPKNGRVRELRLATAAETTIEVAPSPELLSQADAEHVDAPPFESLSHEMFARLGVPSEFFKRISNVTDPNGLECMMLLSDLADFAPRAADALLSFATGNVATRQAVIDVANDDATIVEQFPAVATQAKDGDASSEEFVTFSESRWTFRGPRIWSTSTVAVVSSP